MVRKLEADRRTLQRAIKQAGHVFGSENVRSLLRQQLAQVELKLSELRKG